VLKGVRDSRDDTLLILLGVYLYLYRGNGLRKGGRGWWRIAYNGQRGVQQVRQI